MNRYRIKYILQTINSVRDANGNTYWAFRLTDTRTGAEVRGTMQGGESVITHIFGSPAWGNDDTPWESVHHYRTTIKKNEFRKLVKGWTDYSGNAAQIVPAILAAFKQDARHVEAKSEYTLQENIAAISAGVHANDKLPEFIDKTEGDFLSRLRWCVDAAKALTENEPDYDKSGLDWYDVVDAVADGIFEDKHPEDAALAALGMSSMEEADDEAHTEDGQLP